MMYGAKKDKKPMKGKMNSKMAKLRKKMGNKYGKKGSSKSEGGLNEAGHRHFKQTEGANLKRPLNSGTNQAGFIRGKICRNEAMKMSKVGHKKSVSSKKMGFWRC